ncbi:MAG TPA: hypothetical protein VNO33_20190 [Kofleriaceae bacterium]|nr:hypothetical protein [Kofleriaceae bacterium]
MATGARRHALVFRLVAAALALLVGRVAAAEEEPAFTIGATPAWFLLGGLTGGATFADGDSGGFAGGELSLVRLVAGRFAGLYSDAYRDFGLDATVLSVGPEIGLHLRRNKKLPISIGLDGGAAMRFADETELGASGRLSITIFGMLSIYGRYTFMDAEVGDHVLHAGAMLKFPLLSPFGRGAVD